MIESIILAFLKGIVWALAFLIVMATYHPFIFILVFIFIGYILIRVIIRIDSAKIARRAKIAKKQFHFQTKKKEPFISVHPLKSSSVYESPTTSTVFGLIEAPTIDNITYKEIS